MKNLVVLLIVLLFVFSACGNPTDPTEESATSVATDTVTTVTLEKVWETDTLLTTPESVLHDHLRGVLYVSCIGATPPWTTDGDGFIARLDETGKILDRRWVTDLSGPKGMGLYNSTLYVNDIDRLVAIDVTTGEIINRMPVAEAGNLNDIAVGSAGELYLSDSRTSTAYMVAGQEVTTLVQDTAIGGLNGVFSDGDRLVFAGYGSGKLFTFDPENGMLTKVSDSMPGGDGIEKYKTGFFVSSWNGEVYFLDHHWNRTKVLDTKAQEMNAADIEVVEDLQLLFVPTFFDNRLIAYRIVDQG